MGNKKHPKLVLMRHGQSEWNKQNLFTGWVDVPLSDQGIDEAFKAGERICQIPFDVIFISTLMRAQLTAFLAMTKHRRGKIPVVMHKNEGELKDWAKNYNEASAKKTIPTYKAWQLNERMYGELQGMNKDEARAKFGKEQVHIWRRSFDAPPPKGESLEMTAGRTLPYFDEEIIPHLKGGENVLISAHGNSLRSIVMELEQLSKEEVLKLEIPTGEPLCYSFVNGKWQKEDVDAVQAIYVKELEEE